jgi:poly-gamma-glutamate capsule biosynthesis protein CapA/YwtB (metallophosphatase superfamily)
VAPHDSTGTEARVRAVRRIGVLGVFLTIALAAALLGHPARTSDPRAQVALVATPPQPTQPVAPIAPIAPADPPPVRAVRPPRQHVSVVMSGDLLWHDTVWESDHADAVAAGLHTRFDFDSMLAAMKPVVQHADVAICHEEVPFASDDQHLSSYPVFAAPPEVAPWIASMGWDACTTDSNHSIDQGFDGLVRTADLLERAGVKHVGTFRTPAERRKPVIVTTPQGVRVGIVGGTYSLNGFTLPPDERWAVSMWDARNLIAQARAAKRAGADIVLVQYHGGDEYSRLPNAQQVALVRRLTASPAVDLVFAEHAHVVQPITQVNGTWVVYGMGNMVAQSDVRYPRAYEGITVRFTFAGRPGGHFEVTHAAYIPTYWNHYAPGQPIRVQRVDRALAQGAPDRVRLLEARRMTRLAVNGLAPPGDTTSGLREH